MKPFHYKDVTYELDEQGCLLDPKQWTRDFAEGMARECDVPVLSGEHWDVIDYVRQAYAQTGVCPTIFAACKASGLRPQEMQKLFPAGYHRGLCRIAGVHYRLSTIPYSVHLRESVADLRALSGDKVYTTDVRGFLSIPIHGMRTLPFTGPWRCVFRKGSSPMSIGGLSITSAMFSRSNIGFQPFMRPVKAAILIWTDLNSFFRTDITAVP